MTGRRTLKDRKPSTKGPRTKKPKRPSESSKTKFLKDKQAVSKQPFTLKGLKKPARNPCPFCPKLITRSTDVMRHVQTHFLETSDTYKCTLCTSGFRQYTNLINHLTTRCCIRGEIAADPHLETKRQEAIDLAKAKDPKILTTNRFLGMNEEDREFLKDMAALIRQTKEEYDRRAALHHDRNPMPTSDLPPYDAHLIPVHLRPTAPPRRQRQQPDFIVAPVLQVASGSSLEVAPRKPKQRSNARRPLKLPSLLPIPQIENTGYNGLDDIPELELPLFDPFHAPRSLREIGQRSYNDFQSTPEYPQRTQNFAGPSYAPTASSSSVSPPQNQDLYLTQQHTFEEYQQSPFPSSSAPTHNLLQGSGWPFAATGSGGVATNHLNVTPLPESAWSFAPSPQVNISHQYTQESSVSPTFSAADYGGDNFGISSVSPESHYSNSPVAYHNQRLPRYDQYGSMEQGATDMGGHFTPPFQYPESSLSLPQTQQLYLPDYSYPHSDFSSSYYPN